MAYEIDPTKTRQPNSDRLKVLYDALKEDGADVGDSWQFRDWMMADENNRKTVWQAFKDDGADVGEYDEFDTWLFDLGQQPTAATRPTAQQPTQRNMGTPGYVPNRFGIPMQQQGGMGPVADAAPHPMTPAQPLSFQERVQKSVGMAHNVGKAKADFSQRMSAIEQGNKPFSNGKAQQYDPTTGETKDVYYTTTGQAVSTPMERDVENIKNSPETKEREGKIKVREQIGDMTSEVSEALNQRGMELDDAALHNTLGDRPMGGGAMVHTFNSSTSNGRLSDERWRMLYSAKVALDRANNMMREANTKGGVHDLGASEFVRGMGKVGNPDTWDMGLTEGVESTAMMVALQKADNGEELTREEQLLLDAKAVEMATAMFYASDLSGWYKAGEVTADALPFMLEMMINPAAKVGRSAQSMLTRYALKRFGKQALKRGGDKFIKGALRRFGGRAGIDLLGASYLTTTSSLPRVGADAISRMNGDVQFKNNEEGNIEYAGHTKGEDWWSAWSKGYLSTLTDNYSEMLGEYFAPLFKWLGKGIGRGATNLADTKFGRWLHLGIGIDKVEDFIKGLSARDAYKFISDLEENAQWHGILGEYAEEVVGGIMNAILVGDQTLDADPDTGVFNLKKNLETLQGVAVMGGFFSAMKTVGYRNPAHVARRAMKKADRAGASAFGEQWESIRSMIDGGQSDAFDDTWDGMNDSQKQAILEYTKAAYTYKGIAEGKAKRDAEGIQTQQEAAAEQSYNTGYDDANTDELRSDINMAYTDARAKLVELIGEDAVNDIDSDPLAMQAQYDQDMTVDDNTKSAIASYVSAKSAWDGVQQRINDDAADRADQRMAEGEKMAYKGKGDMQGAIRPLIINEDSSERDPETGKRMKKTVYLVNGNIAIEPNGNGLSREGTDKTIYVYDPETGEAHDLDPFGGAGVLEVGEPISMEDYLANNEQQSQAEVQQAAETAQGKVKVNTPFETPQGRKGVVQSIEGDNAIVLFADGEMEQASMPLAEVQQYADALRRKEYEARHPQESGANGLNGVNGEQAPTAEGQTPTATAETPTEGGNETRAKQIAETIKNVFGGNIDRYITHLSNTINANRKRDRGDVSENSYNLNFVKNNRGLVEQYLTDGEAGQTTQQEGNNADTRTPAQRTYDDVVAKLEADRASKKIDATAKVKADRLTKAQKALKTAQETADNTEYGSKEEQKAEEAVIKAQAEYDAAQQDMAAWDEVRKLRDQALLAQGAETAERTESAETDVSQNGERGNGETDAGEQPKQPAVSKYEEAESAFFGFLEWTNWEYGTNYDWNSLTSFLKWANKKAKAKDQPLRKFVREWIGDKYPPKDAAELTDKIFAALKEREEAKKAETAQTPATDRNDTEGAAIDLTKVESLSRAPRSLRGAIMDYALRAFNNAEAKVPAFQLGVPEEQQEHMTYEKFRDEFGELAGANFLKGADEYLRDIYDYIDNQLAKKATAQAIAAAEAETDTKPAAGQTEGTAEVNNINPNYKPKSERELLEQEKRELEDNLVKYRKGLEDNDPMEVTNHKWYRNQIKITEDRLAEIDKRLSELNNKAGEQPKQEPKLTDKEQATLDKFNTLTKRAGEIKAEVGQLIGEPTQENYDKATDEVKAKVDALLGEYRGLFSELPKDDLLTLKQKVWAMLGSAQEQYRQNESKENGNQLNRWANLDTEINKALRDHYGDNNLYMGDMVVPFKGEQGENTTEQPRAAVGEKEEQSGKVEKAKNEAVPKEKIDDVGEKIAGARKDMREQIVLQLADITEQALINNPLGKVYKRPDLKKAVEQGALREKDAQYYEALFALIDPQKPKMKQADARRKRYNPSYVTPIEQWAKNTHAMIDLMREFMAEDEQGRDETINHATNEHFPWRERDLAEIESRKLMNPDTETRKHEWGDKTTPNPIWVMMQVLDKMGYKAGDKVSIPYGIISTNFNGTSYYVENATHDRLYVMRDYETVEDAIDGIVYIANLKNGNTEQQHPSKLFFFPSRKTEYGETGRYMVTWGSTLRNIRTSEFDTKEEADEFAKGKTSAHVSPIKKPIRAYGFEVWYNNPLTGDKIRVGDAEFETEEEVKAYFEENYDKINETLNSILAEKLKEKGEKKELKADDVVNMYGYYKDGKYIYAVGIDKKYANNLDEPYIVKEFDTRKEAKTFLDENKQTLFDTVLKHKEEKKKVVFFDTGENSRIGEDYRNGKDVTAEDFMNEFGFRGVQFGNWTNQADRQMAVNQAFDAFHDLAKLLGISPRAISLNGELGIAFGSRGVGGFAAHYEPGEVVINLTKTRGAGSLAHEWWHALDNYLARSQGHKGGMVTSNQSIPIRSELRSAFDRMMNIVMKSDYAKRSKYKGEYWGRPEEITARLLAEWADQELKQRGELNTFLSRGANLEEWLSYNYKEYADIERTAGREPMPYEEYKETPKALRGIPYPSVSEVKEFGGLVRDIFNTLQERMDEATGRVALFHRADGTAVDATAKERKLRDAIVDLLRKAGIDVVTESEEGQRVLDMANGRERQHRVYHGSGADFEAFDHTHMGEGEGAQAFGWGTYVTEVEGIGRRYARAMGQPTYQGRKYNDIRDYWNGDGDTQFVILQLLRYLEREPSRTLQEAIDFTDKVYELRIARYNGQNEDIRRRTILNSLSKDDFNTSSTLYTVEIPEDNGSNYLDWKITIPKSDRRRIADAVRGLEGEPAQSVKYANYTGGWGQLADMIERNQWAFQEVRDRLLEAFGGRIADDKKVSELMHSAGFVGVKYPAEYYSGGRSDGAKNYVIFNEGDLQITDKVKFFRTESGEAYGFTMGGKIYLDPKIATAETPIHEYTHLWAAALRAANPKAWERLKSELEKDKDLMAYVQRLYPELKGDELMDEVFAHFSGRRGAERMRAEQERMEGETHSLVGKAKVIAMFENLRDALKKFWNAARELFAGKGVKNESAEGFADMVLADLVSGFNPRASSDVRFRGEEEPVFYSNAMRAVENIKQERATPEQWVKMIEKQGGLKAGEDKWLGLSEWLKGSDAKTLTKGEVLDYIRANEIQIEEVDYSEDAVNPNRYFIDLANGDNEWTSLMESEVNKRYGWDSEDAWVVDYMPYEWFRFNVDNTDEKLHLALKTNAKAKLVDESSYDLDDEEERELFISDIETELMHDMDSWSMEEDKSENLINSTRLRYTTEGLDNKREIAFVVPTAERYEDDEIHFGELGGQAIMWARFGETTDADGKRVLVIDEIQSNRHQEGREKGYKSKKDWENLVKEIAEVTGFSEQQVSENPYDVANWIDTHAKNDQARSYAERLRNGVEKKDSDAIPDAPFDKNWHEVAMKRMLRFAAENGYDKVAWTKGEQQAERYDLGGKVDFIQRGNDYGENADRIYISIGGKVNDVRVNDNNIIVDANSNLQEAIGKPLSDLLGKELTEKVMSSTLGKEGRLSGNGLRIGGEGMKGFYDQILPRFMDKYGKKWGVKTGEVELPNIGDNGLTMWSVDVTDDMRESVMRGQPLFRPKTQSREGGEEAYAGEWYDRGSVERIGAFAGYTPKQIAKMNARQEQTARNKFRDAAEKLHLSDNITFADSIDDVQGLTDKQRKEWRRKKGWYSPRTGKIVIILGNHRSMDDVMKSILHEGVAHHGLRQMFGEHFNTFLDNVYQNAHESIRDEINAMAKKHGWDFREATEEYLAKLAEDTDFEKPQNQSWWGQVKEWFFDMLHKIGFRLHDVYDTITDNELRYVLWRSYQNLVNPGRYNSVVEEAKDIAKQYDLKVGQWDETWTAAETEPNATMEFNGRKIPVWAGNGRRKASRKEVYKPGIKLNEIEKIETEAENDGYVEGVGIRMTMTDGQVYRLWVCTDKEEGDYYETTEFYPQGEDEDIPEEEMTERFGDFFGENINKIFGSTIGGYIMTSGRRGFTMSHDEIMRMGSVRNNRMGSDYNVAADGVAEDAAEYAQRDAEYMEAVESGDMEKAQRMVNEAAKRAMPDTKVVDENGNPLVVYHGTPNAYHFGNVYTGAKPFTVFNEKERGKNTMAQDAKFGFFFTPDERFASYFRTRREYDPITRITKESGYSTSNLYAVFLNMRNPLDLRNLSNEEAEIVRSILPKYAQQNFDVDDVKRKSRTKNGSKELQFHLVRNIDAIKANGYDGIINYVEDDAKRKNVEYEAFNPSQIKSADPVTYDDNGNVIPLSQRFNEGSDDIRFRDGEDEETGAPKPQARGAYERMVSSAASQWKEAMQDSMLSLKKLYQAVSQAYKGSTKGGYRIEDEKGYENAYLAENRMHSMSEAQIHAYQQDYMKPLQRAIHALTGGKREAYETLTDYMMAKHGLERNIVMAKRDAKKAWEKEHKAEKNSPNYEATKNAVFANIDAETEDTYLAMRRQDYAGLTALTGKTEEYETIKADKLNALQEVEEKHRKGELNTEEYIKERIRINKEARNKTAKLVAEAEKEAQRIVDEYEKQHDTTDLWIATNRATRRSLFKMLESGLLSPQRHAEIRDMFQYYIPLQGFDSDVAEDVYAYMGSDGTAMYGTTIRAAKGRKSKADDPIATIAMNGEAAIRRGNRNLMKQHFLRFVQSHPTDLVSINDVWLRKNANGEWEQYFDADLKETDTPEEVARKVRDFNERMEQEAAVNPDLYKRSRELPNVPFRVLNVRDMDQHQVMVQVDGKNYMLTINGNPRAAQALNGLTNPDVFTQGAFGTILNATESVVRTLSQFYTTRNPNFVLSNFLRDAVYTNSMVLAKESPNYALNFHKNFLLLPNERMGVLFASWENGKLREKLANGTASNMEKMFYDFMMNGGETGWTSLRDIEKHKRDLQKALKREGNIAASALNKLGDFFDITNRMIENHARFTAYVTSIEMGRSVERAVWDAKEISVNFNKKGAGDKFLKAKNQTFVGKVGAFVSGLGRRNYAFWNASLQGLNNIARIGKRNPAKFMAVATPLLGLGVAIPLLNALLGGDDDDDKNAYWNLPEYVRRSNICFRFTKDMPWITIPLPIEFRAIYGLGELGSGVALGKEYYSKGELTKQVAAQFSQVLPLDFMEGGGGWHCIYPTYVKPVIEAYSNQSWTGLPIYRKNTYGQYDVAPEWQRAYSNTNNQIMAATKWLNEATGGDEVQGGNIDFNPARIEYMLRGYLGGYFTVADQVIKMGETATGNREFEWRNMMLANRVVKEGDERTEARKLTNEYFNLKEEYDKTDKSLKAYKKKQDEGTLSVVGQAHYIALMNDSEEYGRYLVFGTYKPLFDAYYKQIKEANAAGDSEEAKRLERGQNELRREMVNIIHDMDNGGTFDRKKVATGINENLKKMQNDKLWNAQDKAIDKSIEANKALNPTDNVEE